MGILKSLALAAVFAMGATCGGAQDFEKAVAAYNAGDYQTALKQWLPLATQGKMDAQAWLGYMYENGKGVSLNYSEAIRLYKLAADQGQAWAQSRLGFMYDTGQGVLEDDAEAVKWYRRAADQGDVGAQRNLGIMFDKGEGVLEDDAKAVSWFRLAAEQDDSKAQLYLGDMYLKGEGVIPDYDMREQVYAYAKQVIGLQDVESERVSQMNIKAHMWYNIASANGSSLEAAKAREDVEAKMNTEEIEKAQGMARECLRSDYQKCGN